MKELLVYRHAKTQRAGENMADFVRELVPRGARQSEEMAKRLKKKDALPDLVLASDAIRAMQTAEITLHTAGLRLPVVDSPELYGSDGGDYLRLVATRGAKATRVMIVGHNPACEELVELLVGDHHRLRTAAIAWIKLPIESWEELSDDTTADLVELMEAKST